MMRTSLAVIAWALVSMVCSNPASADINFIFTPSATGGVNVVGTGSGFVDRADGNASSDWDVQDFETNFLIAAFGTAQTSADSVSGTFSNITTGITETLLNFDVDADGGTSSDNDLDYDTANVLSFSFEDEFSYSMTATFEVGTMAFSDLIIGTHIDFGHTQGAGIAEESFGITRILVAVPEPGSLAFLACCSAIVSLRRRRNLS